MTTRQLFDRTFHHPAVAILLAVLVSMALVFAGLTGCNGEASSAATSDAASQPPPLPVNIGTINYEQSVTQTRSYTGMVRARQSSDLGFEVSGTITEVLVSEGDAVTAGQTLARLDTRTLAAKRAAVVAQLDGAQALQEELLAGPRQERISSAREQVNARQSDSRLAQLNLERRQRLFEGGAISQEEFDQAKFSLDSASANFKNAQQQLSELETGTRKETLAAQASSVRGLASALDEIDVSIAKSTLSAPFPGTISRRYADDGSVAMGTTPVVRLIESAALEAMVGLPADVAADLQVGQTVMLDVGDREIEAIVRSRIREIDPVTRTQNVLLDISQPDVERVVPGELCEWKIDRSVERSGFWVPTSALARGIRGLWSVMAVVEQSDGDLIAEKRDIEIILTESDRVLARGTLLDGERIVADGLHRVADGQRVVINAERGMGNAER